MFEGAQTYQYIMARVVVQAMAWKARSFWQKNMYDGNEGILMSEDGCPAGATRLTKRCDGGLMKTTVAKEDELGLDMAPEQHKNLQDPMILFQLPKLCGSLQANM